jgi:hypothetical protein
MCRHQICRHMHTQPAIVYGNLATVGLYDVHGAISPIRVLVDFFLCIIKNLITCLPNLFNLIN